MSDSFDKIVEIPTDKKEYITSYWSERAKSFRELREKELHSPKELLWRDELLSHLPNGNSLSILDIGCGAGFFSILLSQAGHTSTGIDLTPEMVSESQYLAEQVQSIATFQVMDAENLDFPEASFDVVVARNVTWNLPHPDQAYAEWLRVLKPGGILLNYDAEHAKGHHHRPEMLHNAHANVPTELLDKCHTMYHMLEISRYDRPMWDHTALLNLGASSCEIDTTVGPRIYDTEDEFYIPLPMFLVKATK